MPPLMNIGEIRRALGLNSEASSRDKHGIFGEMPPKPIESIRFHCVTCDHNTSGICPDLKEDKRRCPSCNSPLMYCQMCKTCTSGKEKYKMVVCDQCHESFVTDTTIAYLASEERKAREIVLSGIRATGKLHLGNFFGAIRQFVEYAHGDNLCMYFIANWHTLTTCQDPMEIHKNTIEIAMDYLAAGLDPDRSIIYAQSSVPEIAELALYLAMFQSKNQLEDLPTLKDLVKDKTFISMGHLYYPVLMAADILGPKATVIPVGSDQVPNVELARDLATKFNHRFGHTFTVPRVGLKTIKVPGLAGGKMAKSEGHSSVFPHDTLKDIGEKYAKYGVTDTGKVRRNDPGNPENCLSVYPLFKIILGEGHPSLTSINESCRSGKLGCQECKSNLACLIDEQVAPFREKRKELEQRRGFVDEVLRFGGQKAREIILPTLQTVRDKLGIILS